MLHKKQATVNQIIKMKFSINKGMTKLGFPYFTTKNNSLGKIFVSDKGERSNCLIT